MSSVQLPRHPPVEDPVYTSLRHISEPGTCRNPVVNQGRGRTVDDRLPSALALPQLRHIEAWSALSEPVVSGGLITVHPSFLLRLPGAAAKAREYERFVADLRHVADLVPAIRLAA